MSRYQRILELSDFKKEDLSLLESKKVLLIGVGGVGQNVATSLITNGIKHLTIVDFDHVELSNLNRQILLKEEDIGKEKVQVVLKELVKRNSDADIFAFHLRVDESNVNQLVQGYDIVIDAVDNWKTKIILASACKKNKIPFLHIGVDGYRGQYCLFKKKHFDSVFPSQIQEEPRDGVLGPMVAVIANLASLYLLRYLLHQEECDILYYFDMKTAQLGHVSL